MKFYDIEGIIERHSKAFKYFIIFLAVLGGIFFLTGIILCALSNYFGILFIFLGLASFTSAGFLYYYAKSVKQNNDRINQILYALTETLEQTECITIKELAKKINLAENKTRGYVDLAYRKGLLDNYVRIGEYVKSKNFVAKEEERKNSVAVKCPYCGATFTAKKNTVHICPYCSNALNA